MQSAIQTLAVEDPLKSLPWTQLRKLRKNSMFALSQILNKKEVKRIYEHFLSRKKNIYSEKVEGFLERLREVQWLRQNWGMSGVTLEGDMVLIDHPDCCNPTLVMGYQVCIALHQFAHFLSKSFPLSVPCTPQSCPSDIRELIDLDSPYVRYEEVGCQAEKQLFGQVLLALKDQAARVLLEWAEGQMERREFEGKFAQKNGVSLAKSVYSPHLYLF